MVIREEPLHTYDDGENLEMNEYPQPESGPGRKGPDAMVAREAGVRHDVLGVIRNRERNGQDARATNMIDPARGPITGGSGAE